MYEEYNNSSYRIDLIYGQISAKCPSCNISDKSPFFFNWQLSYYYMFLCYSEYDTIAKPLTQITQIYLLSNPIIWHTTSASFNEKLFPHTLPHIPLCLTSSRPSYASWPPTNFTGVLPYNKWKWRFKRQHKSLRELNTSDFYSRWASKKLIPISD